MKTGTRIALLVVVAGVLPACGTSTALKPNPQPQTSYEMLVPKTALRYSLAPGETAVQPMPDKQVAPAYPPTLIHPGAAPVTVVAQLVMGRDGRVQGVYPVSNRDTGPDRKPFETAVEHAAMQWTFTPLWLETPNGDGTYELTAMPFGLWYVFHFKVVNGKPVVETAKR
jgi:hypothetical protein